MKKTLLLACIFLCACNRNHSNQVSLFKDDGHRKAAVAFVPVVDNSESELPWSLSEEFTSSITQRLTSRNNVLLAGEHDIFAALDGIDDSCQPFNDDMQWMKKTFQDQDFVVFTELIDHYLHTHPNQKIADLDDGRAAFLDLTMRVRVIDLRGREPQVVLQEIIHHDHNIPKFFANIDYAEKHWGKTSFHITPVGLAHAQLTREMASRLDDYISIAKSK